MQGSVVRMLSSSGATRSAWFEGYASHLAPRATTPAGVGLGNVLRDCACKSCHGMHFVHAELVLRGCYEYRTRLPLIPEEAVTHTLRGCYTYLKRLLLIP